MHASLLLASIAIAGVLELVLLRRIVFHQAGGWATPNETFLSLLAWAGVPLIAGIVLVILALKRHSLGRIAGGVLFASVAPPLLAYVALAQYSHSTPFFMMIGYALQWIALVVAAVRLLMPPNSTVETDARKSGARGSL